MIMAIDPTREEIKAVLQATAGRPPVPQRRDRQTWARLGELSIAREVMAHAEAALTTPLAMLPATQYLHYHRTGERKTWEQPLDARRDRLVRLALAECLEGEGRFLDAILDTAWAMLDEATWVIPAHDFDMLEGLPSPDLASIDLWSAMACHLLAEVDWLLDDALHPALRARIRAEVARRGFDPLLARDDMRWMANCPTRRVSPNWAPVCAGLTVSAAIYLEPDLDRLAMLVFKAIREIGHWLDGFPEDGGCLEGIGYWEKGMFAFALFAELLAARTEGRIDLVADAEVHEIARFPWRVHLGEQLYPLFSDNNRGRRIQIALLHYLARRLSLPELAAIDPTPEAKRGLTTRYPAEQIRDFLWWDDRQAGAMQEAHHRPNACDWLPEAQWFVARLRPDEPDGLILAAKGGHNGEPHNHNDVGSFEIILGGRPLIAEIGAGVYSRDTFIREKRYTMLMYGSQGHSVPVVNGHHQTQGAEFAARDVEGDNGGLRMNLGPAYPDEAGLLGLDRQFRLDRAANEIALHDHAVLASPGRMASVLVTFEEPQQVAGDRLRLGGQLDVVFEPEKVGVTIDCTPNVRLRNRGEADVTRIMIKPHGDDVTQDVILRFVPSGPG